MAAWPHQIHLSDPVIHCHICVPGQLAVTPTRSPDLSDRSHGAKTETDFVMTHPDNKNISKTNSLSPSHSLARHFTIFACCIDGQAYLVKMSNCSDTENISSLPLP